MAETRVRFAPSPTGYLHVGGARTALFNWLFARHHHGKFILRIEDTDLERSQEAMVQGILDGLRWLGLEWDEGPFFQSQRLQRYQAAAARLIEAGWAYPCFCSAEELAAKREAATQAKADPKYDGACRHLTAGEIKAKEETGITKVIRFKVPESGSVSFEDEVFGLIETDCHIIEDFVLLRPDGMPTYHLGVVVDDIDMAISHVIRGADHISNTPKQILLYQALGAVLPRFVHVPLILGPDKSRLSKRHGATSVTAYRDQGFMTEAFRNFLALLGWAPGDKKEIMSTAELIEKFSLGAINKSNAVFNLEKLAWLNAQYLSAASGAELLPYVKMELQQAGLWLEEFDASRKEWFLSVLDLLKPRAKRFASFIQNGRPFWADDYPVEQAAQEKFLSDPILRTLLPELACQLDGLEQFTLATTEAALRGLAEARQVKAGLLINAARVCLTGQAVAPGIFDVMVALGKERTIRRLKQPPF